ncbi:hypothetical protein WJX84_010487 [Apatococcus fuscideae]|uniref:Uncharacterized protein n=1 Tax=Apatococcus fuscideae TaxID=2026836 RepID=A0AAW1SPW8_9CHLO
MMRKLYCCWAAGAVVVHGWMWTLHQQGPLTVPEPEGLHEMGAALCWCEECSLSGGSLHEAGHRRLQRRSLGPFIFTALKRYLLEHDYLLSVPVMNAAAVLRPWALALKINLLLREADCPWGATTTLAAAGRAPLDAQPIQWLLDNGCPANRSTVMRLICHADWIDLACKALRNRGTLHRAHAKRVQAFMNQRLAICSCFTFAAKAVALKPSKVVELNKVIELSKVGHHVLPAAHLAGRPA